MSALLPGLLGSSLAGAAAILCLAPEAAGPAADSVPIVACTFTPEGISLAGGEERPWTLALKLRGWGRGEVEVAVEEGTGAASERGWEVRRGPLAEWYRSEAGGIEQGFTIAAPPPVAGRAGEPLRLALAVEGDLAPEVFAGGRDARFCGPDGVTRVFYTGLRAWDAAGRELAAELAAEAGQLAILVADRFAAYPLTVDPWIWTEEAKLTAADGAAYDLLGESVAVDGDTALVGARGDDDFGTWAGAAYVFVRSGTLWSQQAKLHAAGGAAQDEFGRNVAVSGDTALVGAHLDDDVGPEAGAAYVFVRSGTAWSQQAKLLAPGGAALDQFGWGVALDGDTALVGAHADDDQGSYSGSAYVFVRSGTTWSQQAKLLASDGDNDHWFGYAVSIDGDTALVGAWGDDDFGSLSGSAYVFERSGTDWTEKAKLLAADGAAGDYFGFGVSLDGDTALIGAAGDDVGGPWRGSAYVFARTAGIWSQQAKLLAADGAPYDEFGASVSLAGDRALVGSYLDDDFGTDSGAAYVFVRSGTAWSQQAKLLPADGAAGDEFGKGVALAGDTALVGSPWDDDHGAKSGAAYVFLATPQAHALFRTAGANPASLAAVTLPVLGTTYTTTVDLAGTTGHAFAWLVGYATPLTLALGGGQVLLVNIADAAGELLGQVALPGPVAAYDLPVPGDPALAGFALSTQALHVKSVAPFALSNALDLFVGY
ncbi:MAG: FG-GAP repeat protein [Planctomycetota bacterium]